MVLTKPEELLAVNEDARRLEQVMLSLLSNAMTYAADTERIQVRLRRESGEAELQVQDYGPGIVAEELAEIFTPFRQGQGRGCRYMD